MYRGWIILPNDELGGKITVECGLFLKNKQEDGSYDVELSDEGFNRLDKYWGNAYWGLEHYEEVANVHNS